MCLCVWVCVCVCGRVRVPFRLFYVSFFLKASRVSLLLKRFGLWIPAFFFCFCCCCFFFDRPLRCDDGVFAAFRAASQARPRTDLIWFQVQQPNLIDVLLNPPPHPPRLFHGTETDYFFLLRGAFSLRRIVVPMNVIDGSFRRNCRKG